MCTDVGVRNVTISAAAIGYNFMAKQENRPIRQRAFYALQKENSLLRQMVADLEEELIKLRQQLEAKEK
jgi:hypothetical protein